MPDKSKIFITICGIKMYVNAPASAISIKVEEKWPLTRVKLFFTHPTGDSSGSNVKT